ncbi:fatty acyl-CoA hydrolase precursor, medium chain-like [Discoglossus pictus]
MDFLIRILLLLCLALVVQGKGQDDANTILAVKHGKLQGKTLEVKETDRTVHVFYRIPFARPPVGPLRFAPPQPPEPWGGIRDATQPPPICLQDQTSMEKFREIFKAEIQLPRISEDCLFLNVYTPANRDKNSRLPVMVFIHGGAFTMGGAFMFDGSALSAYENVVTVAIQYRLGIPGFFSTADKHAPGNFGLLDQVAALQWVQENIEHFGGDPDSVTIFGESAGGVSVAAHVISPLSKGLFQKAISESGVATIPGLVVSKTEDVLLFRNFIANISGCDSPDSNYIVNCLKKKSEDEIVDISKSLKIGVVPACVDGLFFPKSAEEILAAKESNPVPFIVGVNNHEFGWILPLGMNLSGTADGMDKDTVRSLLLNIPMLGVSSELVSIIMDEYFGHTDDPHEIRNQYLDLCGDTTFVLPALKTARYHRDSGLPVYFYEFQHRPSFFHDLKPDYVKADHGDELFFVFGAPFVAEANIYTSQTTDEEKTLSRTFMKYWANFARNGNPNGPGLVQWSEYGKEEDYLEINLKQKSSKKLKEDKVEFWTIRLPEKIHSMKEDNGDHAEL